MMESMPPPPPPPPPPSSSGPHTYLHLTSNAAETSSPSSSSLSATQRADRHDQLSGSASPSQPQPSRQPQQQQQQQQHHPSQPHSHLIHGGPHSPKSSQSSPYVSPRPQHRDTLDASSMSMPPHAPILRRGAVSGASGPLSFPPLPTPFRSHSDGPSDDGSRSRPSNYSQGPDYEMNMAGGGPQHDPHHHQQQQQLQAHQHPHHLDAHHYQQHPHAHQQQHEEHPAAGSMMPVYQAQGAGNSHHQHHGHFSGGQPATRMPSFSAGSNSGMGPSGVSILTPGSSASPSFPLPSSYSLSSGGSAGPGGMPSATMSSSYGAQRRGGLSASSGVGVYGAAAQAGATPTGHHPYWSPHNPPPSQMHMGPHSTGAGFKRKQTSANPPPRNYACPSCPASFSRRHDLNRHSRIHLAVKPYGCPNCQKSFSRKDALKRHLMVKGCGKDAEGRPKKRRGRKSAAERLAAAAAAAEAAGEDGKPSGLTVGSDGVAHGGDWTSGHGSDRITPMDEGDSDEEDEEDEEDDYEDQGPAMRGHGMGFDDDEVQGYPGRGAAQRGEGSESDMQPFYSRSYDQDHYPQGSRNGEEHGDPYQHQQAWA